MAGLFSGLKRKEVDGFSERNEKRDRKKKSTKKNNKKTKNKGEKQERNITFINV